MRRFLFSTSCLACVFGAVSAYADIEAPTPDVAGVQAPKVEDIVVTATRTPMQLDKVGSSVTVLTEDAIRSSQVVAVSDLLAQTPGVAYSRNGGVGQVTYARIRGAESDQTVVVIDGVKADDPSLVGGGYDFANLMIGDIQRIEILRGAQSTLWGSEAIGGVVNIVTAVPTKPLEVSIDAEGGSYGTGYGRVGVGGKSDRVTWRAAGGYYTTNGVSAFAGGTEPDGYHDVSASGQVHVEIADGVSADFRGAYSHGHVDFDGFPPPLYNFADDREYGLTKELVGYAGLNFDLWDGRLRNRLSFGYTDHARDYFNPDQAVTPVTFESSGKNKRGEYQGTFAIAENWNAVFGAEVEKSSMWVTTPSDFDPNPAALLANATLVSGYAQIQGEVLKGLTLTGGLRHDSHDTFGQHTLGQASAAWAFNDGNTVVRASFGQGFKAPTLYQLYSIYGNTALRPEQANSWDGGIEQHFADGAIVLSATWFLRNSSNLITFVSCPAADPLCTPGKFGVYENTARAKAQGLELSGSAKVDQWTLQANYTLTDTKNTSAGDPNHGKELARRPRNTANASATYMWPRDISTGIGLTYAGNTFDNAANSVVLPSYVLVDLHAAVPINTSVEVYGRIENLFDKAHATARSYGSLGRGVYGGIRARF
ncbi:MAG: TonB-dependent receptor [Rhodospirillaceae bacterium]|nr:MAG: TonB-dependent receptor [Rhodospirillaceae bacterium]